MESLSNLANYILTPSPGQAFAYYYIVLSLIVVLFVGSFVFKKFHTKKTKDKDFAFKRLFRKVPAKMIYFGIALTFLLAVRYENIPYFAMRLWLYLTALLLLAAIVYYAYKYFKVYPKELQNLKNRPLKEETPRYTTSKKR